MELCCLSQPKLVIKKLGVKLLALSRTQRSSRARDSLARHVFPKCYSFTSPRKNRVCAVEHGLVFCLKHPLVCQTVSCCIVISHLFAWQCQAFNNITQFRPKNQPALIFSSLFSVLLSLAQMVPGEFLSYVRISPRSAASSLPSAVCTPAPGLK